MKPAAVSRESLTAELLLIHELAVTAHDYGAAVKALVAVADLRGLNPKQQAAVIHQNPEAPIEGGNSPAETSPTGKRLH